MLHDCEDGRLAIRLEDQPRVAKPRDVLAYEADHVALLVNAFARHDVGEDTLGRRATDDYALDHISSFSAGWQVCGLVRKFLAGVPSRGRQEPVVDAD